MSSTPRRTPHSRLTNGFSLVELSVVVAILSVVAVLGLELAANFVNRTAGSLTKDRLAVVDDATAKFFRIYGRLPCPAVRTTAPSASAYGLEDCTIATFATGTNYAVKVGGGLMAGAVPFRTLNLPMSYAIDGWNDKINYIVTKNLTVAGGSATTWSRFASSAGATLDLNGVGGIEVRTGTLVQPCDGSTPNCQVVAAPATSTTASGDGAAYFIFSNGSDKRGAYSARGVAQTACIPAPTASYKTRPDAQNCVMGDSSIQSTIGASIAVNVFYDNRYNAGLNLKSYFDDYVVWRPKAQL